MDPARLAELEAAWPIEVPVPEYSNGPIGPGVVVHELIAEIRRLRHPTVTVSWKGGQETLPLDKVVFHIERLLAVREAAEIVRDRLRAGMPMIHDPAIAIELQYIADELLGRALSAAQDPAR